MIDADGIDKPKGAPTSESGSIDACESNVGEKRSGDVNLLDVD